MPPCVNTSEFLHAAMRPDVLTETVVEVSTEDSEPMEVVTVFQEPEMLETEPTKRRKCENMNTVKGNIQIIILLIKWDVCECILLTLFVFIYFYLNFYCWFNPFSWAETQTPSHFKRISRPGHQEEV